MADLHGVLEKYVANEVLPGAVGLVARGDRIEVAAVGSVSLGGAPMARDSIFRIASITEPITAASVMMLVDDGRITLDARVREWLPELAEPAVARTPASEIDDVVPAARPNTVLDLLSSSAGYGFASDFSLPAVQRLFSVQKDGREPRSFLPPTPRPSIRGTSRDATAGSAAPGPRPTSPRPPARWPSCSRRWRRTAPSLQSGCGTSGGTRPAPPDAGARTARAGRRWAKIGLWE